MLIVNIPKEINHFCPKCKKHVVQKISIYKAGKRRGTAAGEKKTCITKKRVWWSKIPQACKACKNNKESYTGFHMPRMQEENDEEGY